MSDVRPGEGATAALMTLNVFLVMLAYYVIKTVREPLILASAGGNDLFSGAEGKAYAAAFQALLLIPAARLYARLADAWPVMTLIRRVLLFFALCLVAFWGAAQLGVPYLGFVFFVWVGIFNVAAIAQFWAFANDIYARESGERIFPVVMIGMTLGGFVGGKFAELLFRAGVGAYAMMPIAALLLLLHLGLYGLVARRGDVRLGLAAVDTASSLVSSESRAEPGRGAGGAGGGGGAFALIARSSYLTRIALMLVLANLVNTTGEYMLSVMVTDAAAGASDEAAYIGAFYGDYYGTVSLLVVLVQTFLVSRIVKFGGIRAALFALPIIAFGAYGLIAAGVSLSAARWAKTAENTADYSIMGTAKAMLWLPTTHEEKYKAKLAIDTFFVRLGDLLAAGLVAFGVHVAHFALPAFASVNGALIVVWLVVAETLARSYRAMGAGETFAREEG